MVALVGANGAGKTTLLKTISGLDHAALRNGIELAGKPLSRVLSSVARVQLGLAHVPEGRQIFGDLSVRRESRDRRLHASSVKIARRRSSPRAWPTC